MGKKVRFRISLPEETVRRIREVAGDRRKADVVVELVEEGLKSVRSGRVFEGLRKGELSLVRAAEMLEINPWEICRMASREEVVHGEWGDVERGAEAFGECRSSIVIDSSILVPLYDAGLVAEFSRALRKQGIGSPVIPYDIFTIVYGFAKSIDPEEDVSKPLRIYKVMEISRKEKEEAAAIPRDGVAFVDKEAVYIAKREGLALLTNDAAVAELCRREGVLSLSLASALLRMLRDRALTPGGVAEIVYGVQWTGPRLSDDVVELILREAERS